MLLGFRSDACDARQTDNLDTTATMMEEAHMLAIRGPFGRHISVFDPTSKLQLGGTNHG